ncbi:hypothetical protein DM860_007398 [Cuscuta australis]|uniref:Uncharacterized protein n=1 Tax=Cuscuta australis TaxID=267555 RepID=A0A328E540_9ASTE|nr:hypothetical protein DM860_007398 [Cuscuta australis]
MLTLSCERSTYDFVEESFFESMLAMSCFYKDKFAAALARSKQTVHGKNLSILKPDPQQSAEQWKMNATKGLDFARPYKIMPTKNAAHWYSGRQIEKKPFEAKYNE